MTQDEIIEMAKEAGITAYRDFRLESFARRIHHIATAKEREACAKLCEDFDSEISDCCANAIRARAQADRGEA